MDAKKLMIGNLIKSIHTNNIITVDLFLFNEINDDITYLDSLFGIRLTEEWLLKFGFNKDNNRYFKNLLCLHINYTEDSTKYFNYIPDIIDEFTVKYVHQLQNLYFALTTKHLEIIK